MVAPEQEEVLWVFDFICQQKADGLKRLFTPIHIVPKEQVVTFRRIAAIFKEPQEIIVLPMDVTCKEKSRIRTRIYSYINSTVVLSHSCTVA